jgi:hypothetical protein
MAPVSKATMSKTHTPRLFAILARDAPQAVIFRRGPSKQVLLIKWNLKNDKLEYGQWFKGRIYERRCDLSPSGNLLIYFSGKYKTSLRTWTAISKPPYLTALALWPKGDAWGGGGIFDTEYTIRLNHGSHPQTLAQGFTLKKNMRVISYGGGGEDFPIYHALLLKYDWQCLDEGKCGKPNWNEHTVWKFIRPIIYEKVSKQGYRLQMHIKSMSHKNDAWYNIDYVAFDKSGKKLFELEKTDWADWDNSDLIFAKQGKLFRLSKNSFTQYMDGGEKALKLVADLNSCKYEEKTAPCAAVLW